MALVIVLVLSLSACGSGNGSGGDAVSDDTADRTEDTSGDAAEEEREGGALGAPIGPGREGAVASPIRVPAVPQQGASPEEIQEFLDEFVEPEVRKSCGGNLCIAFRLVDQNGNRATDDECGYVGANPGGTGEHEVNRGSVVRLVFRCPSATQGTSGSTDDGGTTNGTEAPPPTEEGQ